MSKEQALRLGVIGNPIRHSQSPKIHQTFAEVTGVAVSYERYYAKVCEFEAVVQDFFQGAGTGLNVTLPFKERAANMAQVLSERAKKVGAVNTLWIKDGVICGDTTDGAGFVTDVKRQGGSQALKGVVVIIGAGGAVRSLLPDLLEYNPKAIHIYNRTKATASALVEQLRTWSSSPYMKLISGDLDECQKMLNQGQVSLLIQGASGQALAGIGVLSPSALRGCFCYDLNYGQRAQSFLVWAKNADANQVCDGWGMLVGQASVSFSTWTGQVVDMDQSLLALKMSNPWLESWQFPPFNDTNIELLRDALSSLIAAKKSIYQTLETKWQSQSAAKDLFSVLAEFIAKDRHLAKSLYAISFVPLDPKGAEFAALQKLAVEIRHHYEAEYRDQRLKELVRAYRDWLARFDQADTEHRNQCDQSWCDKWLCESDLVISSVLGDELSYFQKRELVGSAEEYKGYLGQLVAKISPSVSFDDTKSEESVQNEYFSISCVQSGLIELVEQLFSVRLIEDRSVPVPCDTMTFYALRQGEKVLGGVYIDIHQRAIDASTIRQDNPPLDFGVLPHRLSSMSFSIVSLSLAKSDVSNVVSMSLSRVSELFYKTSESVAQLLGRDPESRGAQ